MWLGSKKQCVETFLNFIWKTKVKILLVYFCNDKCTSCVEENWTEIIQAIKKTDLYMGFVCVCVCVYCWKDMYY